MGICYTATENEHGFFLLLLPPSLPILNTSGTSSVITHDAETNPRADALSVLCNANAGGMWPRGGCRSPASVGGPRAAQGFILSDSHKTNFSLQRAFLPHSCPLIVELGDSLHREKSPKERDKGNGDVP